MTSTIVFIPENSTAIPQCIDHGAENQEAQRERGDEEAYSMKW